jgi:hypothetical protein
VSLSFYWLLKVEFLTHLRTDCQSPAEPAEMENKNEGNYDGFLHEGDCFRCLCKAIFRPAVPMNCTRNHVDNIFRNVGGMVRNALQMA